MRDDPTLRVLWGIPFSLQPKYLVYRGNMYMLIQEERSIRYLLTIRKYLIVFECWFVFFFILNEVYHDDAGEANRPFN